MNSLLLVIDVQNDFINEYTKPVLKKIEELIAYKKYNNIVFTRFINNYESQYYIKAKYKGCLDDYSKSIAIKTFDNKIIDKPDYTSFNDELAKYISDNNIDDIYICGIDTECCVLKTALDMFEKGYNIYVLKDYCACMLGTEYHNNAIELLKRNIGDDFVI